MFTKHKLELEVRTNTEARFPAGGVDIAVRLTLIIRALQAWQSIDASAKNCGMLSS
jgi:hypothetical protein